MKHLPFDQWPKQAFAGFWIRLAAYLIDWFLVGALSKIILNLTVHHWLIAEQVTDFWLYRLIKLALFLAYFTATALYFNGQTVGKFLLNLEVINLKTGTMDRQTILLREIAGRTILYFFPIVAVSLVFTSQRQHLIDLFCDTAVINRQAVQELEKLALCQL